MGSDGGMFTRVDQCRFKMDAAISMVAPLHRTPELLHAWSEDPVRFTTIIKLEQEMPPAIR